MTPKQALTKAVNRAIANGSPVYENIAKAKLTFSQIEARAAAYAAALVAQLGRFAAARDAAHDAAFAAALDAARDAFGAAYDARAAAYFATYNLIRRGEGVYRLQSTDQKTGVGRVYGTLKLTLSQARQQAKVDGVELLVCD